jgi:hypothetical protein
MTPYERLAIQMELLVPVLRRLQDRLGAEVVLDALRADLEARIEAAAADREARGRRADLSRVAPGMAHWAQGGALDYEVVAEDDELVGLDVHRCRYTDLMDRLGARDLGQILVCGEDHVGAARVGMRLDRSMTHMAGDGVCDFRFTPVELTGRGRPGPA